MDIVPFPRWLWPLPLPTVMVKPPGKWQSSALLSLTAAGKCRGAVLVRSGEMQRSSSFSRFRARNRDFWVRSQSSSGFRNNHFVETFPARIQTPRFSSLLQSVDRVLVWGHLLWTHFSMGPLDLVRKGDLVWFWTCIYFRNCPMRGEKVKTSWKVESTQTPYASLHCVAVMAQPFPTWKSVRQMFSSSRRANANVERDLEGMFISPSPSHGEEATGVIRETSPFKTFPWPWTCYWTNLYPGRISHSLKEQLWSSPCLLLFQVSAANRNIVVCQERWAGKSFSYPQALLSSEFSHANTGWKVGI